MLHWKTKLVCTVLAALSALTIAGPTLAKGHKANAVPVKEPALIEIGRVDLEGWRW